MAFLTRQVSSRDVQARGLAKPWIVSATPFVFQWVLSRPQKQAEEAQYELLQFALAVTAPQERHLQGRRQR
jgi:hypothetical protein